jgi:hypothetical protein
MHGSSRSFLSSRSFRPFLTGAAVGALAVIGIADESPPLPCTFQPQVKEQAQTPPSAPALPAPEQRGDAILTPAPSVQESGRVTVETPSLAGSQTLPGVQAPGPAKTQAKANRKAKASRQTKPRPKVIEPAGYWNSSQFAAGLH